MNRTPWWKGTRGEWYVFAQVALFLLVLLGPRTVTGLPQWTSPYLSISLVIGVTLFFAGMILMAMGMFRLGANLTPFPHPKDNSTLVERGPYALVRHPIYSGLILTAFGFALVMHGWLTLGYALVLLVFFDFKSRREEQWLCEKFPGYPDYRKRVRKLIPWVY